MNDPLTCAECQELLPEYAAGSLDSTDRARVAAHLATCAACATEAQIWAAITYAAAVARPGDFPAPSALQRVQSGIHARIAAPPNVETATDDRVRDLTPQSPVVSSRQRRAFPWLATVAALLVVGLLTTYLTRRIGMVEHGSALAVPAPLSAPALANLDVFSVSCGVANDCWAVGSTRPLDNYQPGVTTAPYLAPVLLHEHSGKWAQIPFPGHYQAFFRLTSVVMLSANDGWAVGESVLPIVHGAVVDGFTSGIILRYHAGQWTVAADTGIPPLTQLTMLAAQSGWALGPDALLRFDSAQWTPIHDAAFQSVSFNAFAARAANDVWLAGVDFSNFTGNDGDAPAVMLRYDGQHWQKSPLTPSRSRINALTLPTDGAGWAVGMAPNDAPGVWRYQAGQGWAQEDNGDWRAHWPLTAITVLAPDNIWAAGGDSTELDALSQPLTLLHYDGSHWTVQQFAGGSRMRSIEGISFASPGDGWMVGTYGTILHFTNDKWQFYTP